MERIPRRARAGRRTGGVGREDIVIPIDPAIQYLCYFKFFNNLNFAETAVGSSFSQKKGRL